MSLLGKPPLQKLVSRVETLGELVSYLWQRKLWWLLPMVLVVVFVGVLLVFAQGSPLAPFVYTLF